MRAESRSVRSGRAAPALFPPVAGTRAGSARVSFEDDQDLALPHDLALLDADLLDRAGPRRGHWDLHLHGLEDKQLIFLRDLRASLGADLPNVADELCFDFGHLGSRLRIVRASSTEATSRPRSLARRAAFSTSSPLLFAITPSST